MTISWAEGSAWLRLGSLKQAKVFSEGEAVLGGDGERSEHLGCSWELAAACSVVCELCVPDMCTKSCTSCRCDSSHQNDAFES